MLIYASHQSHAKHLMVRPYLYCCVMIRLNSVNHFSISIHAEMNVNQAFMNTVLPPLQVHMLLHLVSGYYFSTVETPKRHLSIHAEGHKHSGPLRKF